MTTVIILVLCLVISTTAIYFAFQSFQTAEDTERKFLELQSMVDNRLIGIDSDIHKIRKELTINEQSHGVLAIQIQELSKLSKTNELRKEVLRSNK